MLACARLGAVHSVVFGGFAPKELASRVDDAKPKVILSASCGIEAARVMPYKPLLDAAMDLAKHKPDACLILQRPQLICELTAGRDHDWQKSCGPGADLGEERARARAAARHRSALHPLHVGHDRHPQGLVRDNGGHMVALQWSMENPRRRSRRNLVVRLRHWLGGRPQLHRLRAAAAWRDLDPIRGQAGWHADAGAYWRVIAEQGAVAMFTAPTAFRAIKKEDPEGKLFAKYDLSKFRTLFLAGERADPDTIQWAERLLEKPVIEDWSPTETGWCIAGNPVGLGELPVTHGSPTVAMPGYDMRAVDDGNKEVPRSTMGSLVVKLPLPPACCRPCGIQDDRMVESYLAENPGYYKTADAGYIDKDGYVYVMGRTNDIINVAGHRLSTGGMEEVLSAHKDVAEYAVLGIKDDFKAKRRAASSYSKLASTARSMRSKRNACNSSATRSGRWPRSGSRSSFRAFPRHGREKFCAARSRRSPTARRGPCRRHRRPQGAR